ncbi:MAG: 3-phosphoshikimate 1-carboxyvinyltransferase [Spirochaetaceae bacterium]|jgi:3-phosphoshikimate 1-carboxyvinyltransferase|nr:3-phosphoshikimate 1-carboxyvinyltransferase [Spirochaetaceae bacterium]
MTVTIKPAVFSGSVRVPASKSHTIRRLLIAALADGRSCLERALWSLDAVSCEGVCSALGAEIQRQAEGGAVTVFVQGTGGVFRRSVPVLDVGNSGTTLFLGAAIAALGGEEIHFTGDSQINARSAAPLLAALEQLGVRVQSADGHTPFSVRGPWKGGHAAIACPTSQYLSALLLAAPLAPAGCSSAIDVPLLNERPYVMMTLDYLRGQNIHIEHDAGLSHFLIPGGQRYRPLHGVVPADFSSAAFPALAALVSGGRVELHGLDPGDSQGDKAFFDMVQAMGAQVEWRQTAEGWCVSVAGGEELRGICWDMNNTPDMLPAACVLAAFAHGESAFVNVAHARIKETDRIAVMARELGKAGVVCRERADGIEIAGTGDIEAAHFDGHNDHRIVMALVCAGLGAAGPCTIAGAEAAAVTYPDFIPLVQQH